MTTYAQPDTLSAEAYTYRWANPEKTQLIREGADGLWFIGASEDNRLYRQYLESGTKAAEYVEPEPVVAPVLTIEEKLEKATGLSIDEIRAALAVTE